MNFVSRFRDGLYVAYNSFAMLWRHPTLLSYLAVPALIHIILYNVMSSQSICTITLLFGLDALTNNLLVHAGWIRAIGVWLINIINMFMLLFFAVALSRHGIILLNERTTSFRQCLAYAAKKSTVIGLWAAISAVMVFLLQTAGVFNFSFYLIYHGPHAMKAISVPLQFIFIVASCVWALATIFVVPIIAIEPHGVWRNIRTSFNAVLDTWVEILGGACWLAVIIMLFIAPCLVLDRLAGAHSAHGAPAGLFLLMGSSLLGILFSFIISIVYTLFKANIYHTYQKRLEVLLEFIYFPHQFD